MHTPLLLVTVEENMYWMENVIENVFYCNGKCVFNLLNFMSLRNGKVQDKKFRSF